MESLQALLKTCIAAFAPHQYGSEYLMLTEGDRIQERDAPESEQGWSFGIVIYADCWRSEPGWHPPAFVH